MSEVAICWSDRSWLLSETCPDSNDSPLLAIILATSAVLSFGLDTGWRGLSLRCGLLLSGLAYFYVMGGSEVTPWLSIRVKPANVGSQDRRDRGR